MEKTNLYWTKPGSNNMPRIAIEKDKSHMLSFVLKSQEHVIHFMFIIQVELSRVIFSYLFLLLCIQNLIFFDYDVDFFFVFFFFIFIT